MNARMAGMVDVNNIAIIPKEGINAGKLSTLKWNYLNIF